MANRAMADSVRAQQREHRHYKRTLTKVAASLRPLRARNEKLAGDVKVVWGLIHSRGLDVGQAHGAVAVAPPPIEQRRGAGALLLPRSFGAVVDTGGVERQLRSALAQAQREAATGKSAARGGGVHRRQSGQAGRAAAGEERRPAAAAAAAAKGGSTVATALEGMEKAREETMAQMRDLAAALREVGEMQLSPVKPDETEQQQQPPVDG
jgi:hypothetical protein